MSVADEELFDAHAEASADWSWRHEDDFQLTTHLLNQNEELFRMKMTARGEDADGLQGETSLMVAIAEEELLDGRATGSARFSGGDDVALAFTVENQNKGLVSAQMTARGESDDALLLGETTLEVTLAEEKAVDATAHASARWEDDWVLKLSLANDNAAIFAIDGTLDGKVELGSLSGDGAGTLVFTLGDEKALDLAYEGSVSTDPIQLSASITDERRQYHEPGGLGLVGQTRRRWRRWGVLDRPLDRGPLALHFWRHPWRERYRSGRPRLPVHGHGPGQARRVR